MSSKNPLQKLIDFGQAFWWDTLSRAGLRDGDVERMRDENGMRGITSNPTIFQKAISESADYDPAITKLAAQGLDPTEIFWKLAVEDIQTACEVLAPVHESSSGSDGFVSLEVDPHLAFDPDGTLRDVRRLWSEVARPNLMIKIPGTPPCVPAIRQALIEGHNINVTLLFSQQAHIDVMHAYIGALEERRRRGEPIDSVHSVASFFVSRVDTHVDEKLSRMHSQQADRLRGRAAIANAKLAYQNFLEVFSGDRWEALRAAGAHVQRPLWASTSTKDPSYPDVIYVEELIGRDTVNTMPTSTVEAYLDHGQPEADRVLGDVDEARRHLDTLERVGIPMEQVTAELLQEGVAKFAQSFDDLLAAMERRSRELTGRR
jgi:transaldolase